MRTVCLGPALTVRFPLHRPVESAADSGHWPAPVRDKLVRQIWCDIRDGLVNVLLFFPNRGHIVHGGFCRV